MGASEEDALRINIDENDHSVLYSESSRHQHIVDRLVEANEDDDFVYQELKEMIDSESGALNRDILIRLLFAETGITLNVSSDSSNGFVAACLAFGLCSRNNMSMLPNFRNHDGNHNIDDDLTFIKRLAILVRDIRRYGNDDSKSKAAWMHTMALLQSVAIDQKQSEIFQDTCHLFPADFSTEGKSSTPVSLAESLRKCNDKLDEELQSLRKVAVSQELISDSMSNVDNHHLSICLKQLNASLRTLDQVMASFIQTYRRYNLETALLQPQINVQEGSIDIERIQQEQQTISEGLKTVGNIATHFDYMSRLCQETPSLTGPIELCNSTAQKVSHER
eukprot:gene1234-4443_t